MVGLQARGAPALNRVRDLVAERYVGKVLSCTMIITTNPAWGTEITLDWAYMADRSSGNTLLSSPGGHSIDALCYCLGEFKELSSVVANQSGEMIQMTAPDQVLISGVLQSDAVHQGARRRSRPAGLSRVRFHKKGEGSAATRGFQGVIEKTTVIAILTRYALERGARPPHLEFEPVCRRFRSATGCGVQVTEITCPPHRRPTTSAGHP